MARNMHNGKKAIAQAIQYEYTLEVPFGGKKLLLKLPLTRRSRHENEFSTSAASSPPSMFVNCEIEINEKIETRLRDKAVSKNSLIRKQQADVARPKKAKGYPK